VVRIAIDRDKKEIKDKQKVLLEVQAKNEVDRHYLQILQQQLQKMAGKAESLLRSFQKLSVWTNKSIKDMLQDLKNHEFYDWESSDLIESLDNMRNQWKDHSSICSFYYKDEVDILRDKIKQEQSRQVILDDQIMQSCYNLEMMERNGPHHEINREQTDTMDASSVGIQIDARMEHCLEDAHGIIDVTNTHSAVIDLSKKTIVSAVHPYLHQEKPFSAGYANTSPPWYHEFKRRKANPVNEERNVPNSSQSKHPDVMYHSSTRSGFISSWDRLHHDFNRRI
jgi:hypothetical protein